MRHDPPRRARSLFNFDRPFPRGSVAFVADTDSINSDGVQPVPDAVLAPEPEVDLDAIERDLAGVERALERLSDGTYWTDEVTGESLPDHVLVDDPTARRA
jgi:hypothetical protein